jgi:hypothetical protein
MTFDKTLGVDEIIRQKRKRVASRRQEFYEYWSKNVAPM